MSVSAGQSKHMVSIKAEVCGMILGQSLHEGQINEPNSPAKSLSHEE